MVTTRMSTSCAIDVVIMLLCCSPQVKLATSRDAVSSHAIDYGSGITLTRYRRQTTRCRYIINQTYRMTDAFANKLVPSDITVSCPWWCLLNLNCTSVVRSFSGCRYSTNHSVALSRVAGYSLYYRIVSQCPKHYPCSSKRCSDGTFCLPLNASGPGISCICGINMTARYCESDNTTTSTTTTAAAAAAAAATITDTTTSTITSTITVTISAITSTPTAVHIGVSRTTEVVIAVAATAGVVVAGCLAVVLAISVAGTAAATERGATKVNCAKM